MRLHALIVPLWLLLAATGCRTSAAKGPAPQLLAEGKRFFAAGEYSEAKRQFKGVRQRHPESLEAEESLYMLAECYRLLSDGDSAFTSYKTFIDEFPNSRFAVKVAEGQYVLGRDYFERRIPGFLFFSAPRRPGVEVLEHMQIHFRHHRLASDALLHVADFHLGEREYDAAADVLRRLLSDYPRSEHTLRARFELGDALLNQNRGPLYDLRLLYDARSTYGDFIATTRQQGLEKRYAKQLDAARRRIADINNRLAERKYETARFYQRTGSPKSAALYYESCIRDFADSEYAERSRQALADLEAPEEEEQQG